MEGSWYDLHVYVWLARGPIRDVQPYLNRGLTTLMVDPGEIMTRAMHSLMTGRKPDEGICEGQSYCA